MTFWVAGAIAGSAVLGAVTSSKAASGQAAAASQAAATQSDAAVRAAEIQAASANRAADLQYKIWQEQQALQAPWQQAGVNALTKLQAASEYTPFGQQQFQADPGYGFRMSEGMKALERSAAARGGLLSGATGKALTRFGQEMGSQEYMNAFNRYQAERQARLGPLQSLAGTGQTAAQTLASQAGQYGANVGSIYQSAGAAQAAGLTGAAQAQAAGLTNAAAARASGYVGAANALTGALGTGLNYYQGQQYLNALGGVYPSDVRLKTNIVKIGTRIDGLSVYEFDYIWGGPRRVGLMAQEVRNIYPDAVVEVDGYLAVDYSKV